MSVAMPTPLAVLPWQENAWARLRARHPDWPHALLLAGPQGVGKRHFAQVLTAWVLCEQKTASQPSPCGHCPSCQWVHAGTHPALAVLQPETDAKGRTSRVIRIDQVRALQPFLQTTQLHWRVVWLEPAERLNGAAANALLKTLEEPGAGTLFVLVADQPMQLPATVRSRVQRIDLGRIDGAQAQAHVMAHTGSTPEVARRLLNLSSGAPLAAVDLARHPMWTLRGQWLADWQGLLDSPRRLWAVSARWQKTLPLRDFLVLLSWMVHDVLALKLGQALWQDDLDFEKIAAAFAVPQLLALQDLPARCQPSLDQNVQEGLLYDSVMQQMRPQAHAGFALSARH